MKNVLPGCGIGHIPDLSTVKRGKRETSFIYCLKKNPGIFPALGKLKQEHLEFKPGLEYIARLCLKKKKKRKTEINTLFPPPTVLCNENNTYILMMEYVFLDKH
jgi:hypothetical protein